MAANVNRNVRSEAMSRVAPRFSRFDKGRDGGEA
jgi:hypothetical protein